MFDENDLWGPGGPAELHSSPGLHGETAVPLIAKFFDQEGPTSSSSEAAPSGSSGRDSTTPGASSAAVDPSSAAAGASWQQMAPNMSACPPQSGVFYSVTPQQQAQPGWPSSVQWHSAFSSAVPPAPAVSQQVSKGRFGALPCGASWGVPLAWRSPSCAEIDQHFFMLLICRVQGHYQPQHNREAAPGPHQLPD